MFISIAFPPKSDPESLQVLKYYRSMIEKGMKVSVVTSKNPTLFMEPDEQLLPFYADYEQLIELPIKESKLINFIKRKINPEALSYPDSKASFFKSPDKTIDRLENRPDIIYSRSFPASSSILAYHFKEKFNVPWVLHLSDPWIFKDKTEKELNISDKWNLQWEEKCIEAATVVTLTSKKTIAYYQTKYPAQKDKFLLYPNVYDVRDVTEVVEKSIKDDKTPLHFVYTGGMTKERNPKVFLDCIKELIEDGQLSKGDVFVELVGPKDRYVQGLIAEYDLHNIIDVDAVSYEKSKQMQKDGDVLLIFDSPIEDPKKMVFFPSKILDYMTAFRPLLAITPSQSTTSEIIQNFNLGKSIPHNEKSRIKEFILNSIKRVNLEQYNCETLPLEFDVTQNVERLEELFNRLIKDDKKQ